MMQAALVLQHGHMPTAMDAVQVLQAAGRVLVCTGLSAVSDRFGLTTDHNDSQEAPGLIGEDNSSNKEEDVFREVPVDQLWPDEDQINDGLYDPPVVSEHRPSVLMQPMPDIMSAVLEWARGYPGLSATGQWDLALMRPGSLWFADEIHFDLRNIRGQKQSMLFMFDVVTGGMRVAFESSKRD